MIIDGGEIIGNSTYSSCIRNLGNATVSGGTIRQNKMIAMKNDDTGTLTVTGGKIISEDQAIQNWKTAEIEGGEIEGNVYTWAYVEKGTEFAGETTISGGKITGDVAAVNYDGGSAKPQVEVTGNAEITMIYGPYKRQSKLPSIKPAQRVKRRNYKARPGKTVLCLRAAFAVCIAALLGFGGRVLYLDRAARMARDVYAPYVPAVWELVLMVVLSASALLLLYLLERNGRRK